MTKNAYFQLSLRSDGVYLTLYPAKDGGSSRFIYSEMDSYLTQYCKGNYEKILVQDAIGKLKNNSVEIKISSAVIPPIDEYMKVRIADDRLSAQVYFYPPSNGGKELDKTAIINDLVHNGIKYGVKQDVIDKFLEDRCYNEKILIAEATKPVEGKDAKIVYHFETSLSARPKKLEDGSVDFHSLENIARIHAGDLLAELFPAVQGKPGIDVCGGVIKPQKVANKILKRNQNIKMSDDGLKIYSEVNGHAILVDDAVFVSNTYDVPANVDNSTGDISYDGDVHVNGNVLTGFKIQARGNVTVDGVVEGATIVAGGNIVLKRGIQGMSRGVLKSGGSIITKFIENASVFCGADITTESIMHSKVNARGSIFVDGKKGFISGGEIYSGGDITAKTIGSQMGTSTRIEILNNPEAIEEYRALDTEYNKIMEEQSKMNSNLVGLVKRVKLGEKLPVDKLLYIKECNAKKAEFEKRIDFIEVRTKELRELIENAVVGTVKVQGTVYPGVHIIISNIQYFVKQQLVYCKFVKDNADIKLEGL
ncbi:MAG: FapA family protein [Lachnospiraceae bacterium]|nr:FapA family protein [Lachnospiraceae bacterium]